MAEGEASVAYSAEEEAKVGVDPKEEGEEEEEMAGQHSSTAGEQLKALRECLEGCETMRRKKKKKTWGMKKEQREAQEKRKEKILMTKKTKKMTKTRTMAVAVGVANGLALLLWWC